MRPAIADALVAAATASGESQASFDGATAAGDDVTITNFKMTGTDGQSLEVPSIVITNAQPRDPGGFTAGASALDNASMHERRQHHQMGERLGHRRDHSVARTRSRQRPRSARSASSISSNLEISGGDLPAPLGIARSTSTSISTIRGLPRDFTLNINSINVSQDLLSDADDQTKQVLAGLGYDSFVINVTVEGGYETGSDTLTVRNFAIEAPDVGKLAISARSRASRPAKSPTAATPNALANGKLETLTIRFDNAGVVERALDMQAQDDGREPRRTSSPSSTAPCPSCSTPSTTRRSRTRSPRPARRSLLTRSR